MQTFREPSQWLIWGIGIFVVLFVLSIIVIALGPPMQDQNGEQPDRMAEDDSWWAVLHDPMDPERLFAAGHLNLYQRRTGDESWTTVHDEFERAAPFYDLDRDADGQQLYVASWGLMVVRDADQNWHPVDDGLPEVTPEGQGLQALAAHPEESGVVYGWWQGEGLFRLDPDEPRWHAVTEAPDDEEEAEDVLDALSLLVVPGEPLRLVAGGPERIWLSPDGGGTWEPGPELGSGASVFSMANSPAAPQRLWAATFDGLFRSDDAGETWHQVTLEGFNATQFVAVTVHPEDADRIIAVDTQNRVYESHDGGSEWNRMW